MLRRVFVAGRSVMAIGWWWLRTKAFIEESVERVLDKVQGVAKLDAETEARMKRLQEFRALDAALDADERQALLTQLKTENSALQWAIQRTTILRCVLFALWCVMVASVSSDTNVPSSRIEKATRSQREEIRALREEERKATMGTIHRG